MEEYAIRKCASPMVAEVKQLGVKQLVLISRVYPNRWSICADNFSRADLFTYPVTFPLFDTHLQATSLSGLRLEPIVKQPQSLQHQVHGGPPPSTPPPPIRPRITSRRRTARASQVAAARPAHRKSPPHGAPLAAA